MRIARPGPSALLLLIALLVPALLAAPAAADAPPPKERLHVYLLIGQSNMAGRAPLGEDDLGPIESVFLLNDADEWEVAREPLNRYCSFPKWPDLKQKKGPGASFARAMLEGSQGIAIGLVVNAHGGTSITFWKKGQKLFNEAVRRARIAARSGTLKGVLWNQGESDRNNTIGYLDALKEMVTDLREALGAPELPFVASGLHDLPHVTSLIERLPAELPATGFASSEGLAAFDRFHFDAASQELLGERFAREMKRLQNARR